MSRAGIIVVGGSIAATTAAATLRAEGYDGPIMLLAAEEHAPYARPPLSKSVLTGADDAHSTALSLGSLGIEVRTDACATALDPHRRRVTVNGQEELPYDGLVIATGARARRATPEDPTEIVLRSLADATAIAAALRRDRSVVIIGAGVLGFELASACRSLGVEVTMVDVAAPLVGQLGEHLADSVVRRAQDCGVRVVLSPGGVRRRCVDEQPFVELADGTRLDAELVITSIGCLPNVEWLEGSELPVAGGLLVDERCRVAPSIVAAGDVVRVRTPRGDHAPRTPNWTDAINQATTAATALIHGDRAPEYLRDPYFWTEAFGLSLKVAGQAPARGPGTVLVQGEDDERLLQWLEDGQPVTAAAINHRIPVVRLKRLSRAPV